MVLGLVTVRRPSSIDTKKSLLRPTTLGTDYTEPHWDTRPLGTPLRLITELGTAGLRVEVVVPTQQR